MSRPTRTTTSWRDEQGIATPVEMMYLLIFSLAAVVFLGFLGRLHAGFQDHVYAIRSRRGFAIWPIFVASGRKPLPVR